MSPGRLLERLRRGNVTNVAFADLVRLMEALGFQEQRVSGSHRIFGHTGVMELVNVQEVSGQAKPYQVRQVIRLIERYALNLEGGT